MILRPLPFLCGALLALAGPAQAQVQDVRWEDPELPEAVQEADLIVLAEAARVSPRGVAYHVETTLKGPDRGGDTVVVTGLHHPELSDAPPVEVGDRAWLVLNGGPEVYTIPTPTFGRFPVDERQQVVSPVMGSFVRLRLEDARFRALIQGLLSGRSDALADEAAETLSSGRAGSNATYQALMFLSEFGRRTDLEHVVAVLGQDRFRTASTFKVRMAAARALGRIGGPDSVPPLLVLAEDSDEVMAVRSTAIRELGRALTGLRGFPGYRPATERLAEVGVDAPSEPVRFGRVNDPRTNHLDSILDAVLKTLSVLRSPLGVRPALRALEREDDIEAVVAGLAYFAALGDAEHVAAIAFRMREAEAEDAYLNRLFSSTLEELTGERLGDTRAAWVQWSRERALSQPEDGQGEGEDR